MATHRLSYNQLLQLHQGTFGHSTQEHPHALELSAQGLKPLPSEGMGFGHNRFALGSGIRGLPVEGSGVEPLPSEGGELDESILAQTPEHGDGKSNVDKILEKLQKQIIPL